jgi:hypothetical protein
LIVEHAACSTIKGRSSRPLNMNELAEIRNLRFVRNEFKLEVLDQSRAANVDRSLF